MFKRKHHLQVATVLQSLDADFFREHRCYFGGGTAIVLSHDEYRESMDIDFLCSDLIGYRKLRQALTAGSGLKPIVRNGFQLKLVTALRADQYGIRTMLSAGDSEMKFEIVYEGRVSLELPGEYDQICGVTTLTRLDMATSKLLANSDRWADDSVYSRDLIDLAMLHLPQEVLTLALEKAAEAYGDSVKRDLNRAIVSLKDKPSRLDECMRALNMETIPKALLWDKIRALRQKH